MDRGNSSPRIAKNCPKTRNNVHDKNCFAGESETRLQHKNLISLNLLNDKKKKETVQLC